MTSPKVSVVMTTFNRPALLRNTLESIKRQQFDSLEVIVVDDGTDGETKGICESFGVDYIKLRTTTAYRNPAQPNNVGLRRAKGDVVILQNAECQHADPHAITKLYDAVTANNVVFAHVTGLKEDGSPDWIYCGKEAPRPFFFCGAIKKSWITKLRGMDEDYPAGGYDDNDFADRLVKEGVTFLYSDIEVQHQWHPRPTISAEAAAAVYAQKTHAMATGGLGTARNLGREWGSTDSITVPLAYMPPQFNSPFEYRYAADSLTVDWNDRFRPIR
jgi:glycosyltransferase involved in cell wall biosynthesis